MFIEKIVQMINSSETDRISEALVEWGTHNYADFPWRSTQNHFHALVAEVMLQRTKAEQVVPIYRIFTSRYSSPRDAASDKAARILEILEPLGLRWRAKKILELVHELDRRGGEVPRKFEDLVKLPGVGLYAASAYLSFHVGVRAAITDSNAVRLWSRVLGFKKNEETRRKREFIQIAEKMTPLKNSKAFNYAVLDLTRMICRRKPLCVNCPINQYCSYYKQNEEEKHVS